MRTPRPRVQVASFDVFDTLLVRGLGSPRSLALALGRDLAADGVIRVSPAAFARVRLEADRLAHRRHGRDGPVDLRTIAGEVAFALDLGADATAELVRREIALERQTSNVVPAGRRAVRAARARGLRICFLSDMYLPESVVADLLDRHRLLEDEDMLMVSSARRATKRTGALFRQALADLEVPPAAVLHHGDDVRTDVRPARRHGLRVAHRAEGALTPDEAALDRAAATTDGLAGALAGASRLARLRIPASDPVARARRDVTAAVVAPLLVGYVLWLLHRAAARGLDRVLFLSRDGQVLLDIARRLAPRLGGDIARLRLSYLHASRQAWNAAALPAEPSAADVAWVLSHPAGATTGGLLRRLGLDPDDPRVRRAAREGPDPAVEATAADVEWVTAAAASGGALSGLVRSAAAAQREIVVAHLEHEGALDAGSGLVDAVARGTQHRAAVAMARGIGRGGPLGLLMGAQAGGDPPADVAHLRVAWLYDDDLGVGVRDHRPVDVMAIAACAADHGTLLGYRRGADGVEPVLAGGREPPAVGWGLDLVRRTLAAHADALELDRALVDPDADVREAVVAGVERLWRHPTADEARAWGSFPYEYGSGEEPRTNVLAPPMSAVGLLQARRTRHWSSWTEATLAQAGPATRTMARAARAVRGQAVRVGRRLG